MIATPMAARFLEGNEGILIKSAVYSLGNWIMCKIKEEEVGLSKTEPRVMVGTTQFCKMPYRNKLVCLASYARESFSTSPAPPLTTWSNSVGEAIYAWILYKLNEEITKNENSFWRYKVYTLWSESHVFNPRVIGAGIADGNIGNWENVIQRLAGTLVYEVRSLISIKSTEPPLITGSIYAAAIKYISTLKEE